MSLSIGAQTVAWRKSPGSLAWRAARLGCILFAIWCCLRIVFAIVIPYSQGQAGLDYQVFRASALELLQGSDPYALPSGFIPNLNHPTITLLAIPFALLPEPFGLVAWIITSTLCYLLALGLAINTAKIPREVWCRPLPIVLAITYAGFSAAIFMGQISPFLAPLLVLTWFLARRGNFTAAAVPLGALIALKLALLPLALLVLVRHVWKEIAALGLGATIVSVAPLPFVGVRGYEHWLALLNSVDYTGLNTTNMSLTGVLYQVAPKTPHALATIGIVAACVVGLALARGTTPAGWQRVDWGIVMLLLLALLSSPISWDHYGPFLIPVAAIAISSWDSFSHTVRILLIGATVCLFSALEIALLLSTTGLPAPTAGMILCLGLLLLFSAFLYSRSAAPQ